MARALPLPLVPALVAALSWGAPAFGAARATQDDARAVRAYDAGDLESARSLWLERLEAEPPLEAPERARILYNLGNVAASRERWLEAVGWYTASLRLRPRDADAWSNVELARLKAGLEPMDRGDLNATLLRLVSSLTPAESEWLALASIGPLALFLLLEALRGGRLWRRLALAGIVLALAGAAPWAYHLAEAGRDPLLVVDERGTSLLNEPKAGATTLARVPVGERVERLDELPGWVRVSRSDGTRGWLRREAAFDLRR